MKMIFTVLTAIMIYGCSKDEKAEESLPTVSQFNTGMYLIDANRILPTQANPVYDWEVIPNGNNIIILNDSSTIFPDSIYITVNGVNLFMSPQRYEVYGLTPGDWICSGSGVVNGNEFILNLDIEYDGTVVGMQPQQWRLNCYKM
jgi:hypothetical protein